MTKKVFWNCPITTHNRGVKKQKQNQNTTERLTVLGQFCKLIPKYCLANVCAELNKEGIKIAARAFSVWSHIVSMIYCHMAHCISLNDICDGLQNFKGNLDTGHYADKETFLENCRVLPADSSELLHAGWKKLFQAAAALQASHQSY